MRSVIAGVGGWPFEGWADRDKALSLRIGVRFPVIMTGKVFAHRGRLIHTSEPARSSNCSVGHDQRKPHR
jgi:hypothetical protein